jgi:hypothetical protein
MSLFRLRTALFLLFTLLLTSCEKQERKNVKYEMGERVSIGPFTYVVVESSWKNQLGEGFNVRSPQNRFMVLKISVTNTGTSEVSVPMLSIQGSNDQLYQELADGTGVSNWLGVLRNIAPAQTIQGNLLFDVPLGAFRLRVPDSGESGYEKYSWIEIPLRIDADSVQAPLPGVSGQ